MKKAFIGIVAIVAIIVIGSSIKNNIQSQPAAAIKAVPSTTTETTVSTDTTSGPIKVVPVKGMPSVTAVAVDTHTTTDLGGKRPDKFYCTNNGDGTITYGTASWHGWWIFGHWEANPGGITVPSNNPNQACAEFLEGV